MHWIQHWKSTFCHLQKNWSYRFALMTIKAFVPTTLESLNSFSVVFMKKLLVKSAKDELASSDSTLSQVYCNFVITEAEGSFINHVDRSIQNQTKLKIFVFLTNIWLNINVDRPSHFPQSCEISGFFVSSCSLTTRELSFAQFLYFLRKVCVFFSIFEW